MLNEAFSKSKDQKNAYPCGPWLEAVFTYIRNTIWSPSHTAPFDVSVIDAVDWIFQVYHVSSDAFLVGTHLGNRIDSESLSNSMSATNMVHLEAFFGTREQEKREI